MANVSAKASRDVVQWIEKIHDTADLSRSEIIRRVLEHHKAHGPDPATLPPSSLARGRSSSQNDDEANAPGNPDRDVESSGVDDREERSGGISASELSSQEDETPPREGVDAPEPNAPDSSRDEDPGDDAGSSWFSKFAPRHLRR